MKKLILSLSIALLSTSAFAADLTIEGKISKIVPSEKEIYVVAEGKKHEFYFKPTTELMFANGTPAAFTDLKMDQNVKVSAKKVGKKLDPVKVEILN